MMDKKVDCIVLAGGLGTRLRDVVQDLPKPMAPINGIPFLRYLLDELYQEGLTHFTLAVGYKHKLIIDYFNKIQLPYSVDFSIEKEPLGTGGAISLALKKTKSRHVLIVNGDTFFRIPVKAFIEQAIQLNKIATIALKRMFNSDRYGNVRLTDHLIHSFEEKGFKKESLINGGIYLINTEQFNQLKFHSKYSFEKDFLEKSVTRQEIAGIEMDGYFIDIGIPSDYQKAQTEFQKYKIGTLKKK